MTEAALRDHAVAIAEARMAGSAVDVETLLPAREHFFSHRERHVVARIVAELAGVKVRVLVQLSASYGALHGKACGAEIGEEIALPQRLETGLVVHVLAAGGEKHDWDEQADCKRV